MSKSIKILGTGCAKCKQTADVVTAVVNENNIDASVEKVEDIIEIMEYNVFATPAVVVDEKVIIKGRVPSKSELVKLLT